MSGDEVLTAFYRIFQGNTEFYTLHQAPFTKEGKKYKAQFCGFAKYGSKSFPKIPDGFEKGDFVPVTKGLYKDHLNGGNGLAITPLCNTPNMKNACYFAVLDFDIYDVNYLPLIRRLYQLGFKFVPFQSKSGGLHLYFLFINAEQGKDVLSTLNHFIEVFGLSKLYPKGKIEIFPKQATYVPGSSYANGIFLPYYNAKGESPNKMITAEGKLIGISKAIPIMESMFTSLNEVKKTLNSLPYDDAPFCIQAILLTGALGEDAGRNNFLCCVAIYLKNKYGNDFDVRLLEDINNSFEVPLENKDVISVHKSMTDKEKNFDNYWCNKVPCVDFCDKQLCKQRKYGKGRERGNVNTGADCWGLLTRYNAGDGKNPYYTWEVRVNENEDFKILQIDNHDDLLNQLAIQKYCLRDLNWIPTRVKEEKWVGIVQQSLEGIGDRTIRVAQTADTTEMGQLKESFMNFLTHKQIQKNGQPYMVRLGQVYHADGAYYFTTRGLLDYLRIEKFNLGRFNLSTWLEKQQGCIENVKLNYKTASGNVKYIECWKKEETPELLEMDSFYEDVYDGAEDIIEKNKLNKEEEENDTKF